MAEAQRFNTRMSVNDLIRELGWSQHSWANFTVSTPPNPTARLIS